MPARKKVEKEIPLKPSMYKDGVINWRNLISKKNILLNRQVFLSRQIDIDKLTEDEINKLKDESPDKDLLIALGGFRELAKLRGFKAVHFERLSYDHDNVSLVCRIDFVPNEDEPFGTSFEGVGVANTSNTESNFVKFLDNIAENRAFSRCVRNYFGIESMGWDEIRHDEKPEEKPNTSGKPLEALIKKMESKGISFEGLQELIKERGFSWNEAWTDETKIPVANLFTFISILNDA